MKVNQDTIATDGPSLLRISMHYRPVNKCRQSTSSGRPQ